MARQNALRPTIQGHDEAIPMPRHHLPEAQPDENEAESTSQVSKSTLEGNTKPLKRTLRGQKRLKTTRNACKQLLFRRQDRQAILRTAWRSIVSPHHPTSGASGGCRTHEPRRQR